MQLKYKLRCTLFYGKIYMGFFEYSLSTIPITSLFFVMSRTIFSEKPRKLVQLLMIKNLGALKPTIQAFILGYTEW